MFVISYQAPEGYLFSQTRKGKLTFLLLSLLLSMVYFISFNYFLQPANKKQCRLVRPEIYRWSQTWNKTAQSKTQKITLDFENTSLHTSHQTTSGANNNSMTSDLRLLKTIKYYRIINLKHENDKRIKSLKCYQPVKNLRLSGSEKVRIVGLNRKAFKHRGKKI